MNPGEGLPIRQTSIQGSGPGCPLLRASNEHRFTVRVLRAKRAPGRSRPILLSPRVARAQGTHRAILPLLADFFSILLGAGGQGQRWFIELTAHAVNDTQQGRLADHFCLDLALSWEVHERDPY